ncbi:MAG: Ig-like domain-containing protein, partial [Stenotrophomonas sp.]
MSEVDYGQRSQIAVFNHLDLYAGGALPVIDAIIDDQGSRTGNVANGGYTDDGSPDIKGRGRPGDRVHVYDGRYLLGHAEVGVDGTWSFTPVVPLASGKHSISIVHEAPDGDVSEQSAPYVIIVDKIAPVKPQIEEVFDDVGAQTGAVGKGGATDDSTPTVSGKGEAGATVTIIDNGQVIGEALVADDGTWAFTPGAELADGQHEFEVVMTDQAGNASEHSEKHIIVVKAAVPMQVATVTAMGKDWGVGSNDWLTNDGSAGRLMQGSLSAQLGADERLLVSTDGGLSWTVASVEGLNWAAQDTNSHSGSWSIQTRVVNDAGRSGVVESRDVLLDTLAPDAPTKLTVDGAYLTVAFKTDAVTAGDIVSVVLNGQRFDHALTAKDVSAGSVRIAPGFAVSSGDVMAAIIDKAGNSSKYRDMGENRFIDFNNSAYVSLNTGQSTTHAGLRITSEFDYNVWQIPDAINGLTSFDPAVYTGMKIAITGRSRIDFTEGPVSELKFLVTNLQAGTFAPSVAKFYSANGALVGQLSLSAYWPSSLSASFKAPAGQDFSYMVVSTGYRLPGVKVTGDWDWIGLDNFEFRGGASELNVLKDQSIDGK